MSLSKFSAGAAAAALGGLLPLALLQFGRTADAAALHEPSTGKVLLGFWTDTSDAGYQETPATLNEAMGLQFPIFQLSQQIPLTAYNYTTGTGGPAPEAYVEATGTDAALMLTVYPTNFSAVTDDDLISLALQLYGYEQANRSTFLRFAPEMNGNWDAYGLQPTGFIDLWSRMYSIVKGIANQTAIVWSPNTGYSYPYGAVLSDVVLQADKDALDTNNDGQLTIADNPFSPYYPGDDLVDWVGVSMYYKGPDFVNKNEDQPTGLCYDFIHKGDPFDEGDQARFDWYNTYCTKNSSIACMVSESGAAWHANASLVSSAINTQAQVQTAWLQDCELNATFYEQHPRLKAWFHFEFIKTETDGGVADLRDYRYSNSSAVMSAYASQLASQSSKFVWANYTVTPTSLATANTSVFPVEPTALTTWTVTVNGSTTANTFTEFYSGPFATNSAGSTVSTAPISGTLAPSSGSAASASVATATSTGGAAARRRRTL